MGCHHDPYLTLIYLVIVGPRNVADAIATSAYDRTRLSIWFPDLNDGRPWSEMDDHDLKAALEHGSTIEEAAGHLCRSGTVDEVARKADAMGLKVAGLGPLGRY